LPRLTMPPLSMTVSENDGIRDAQQARHIKGHTLTTGNNKPNRAVAWAWEETDHRTVASEGKIKCRDRYRHIDGSPTV
ncbi:MAG: hypothetical protein P8176_02270, partial [Gammaproteobacteria bacterium]